MILFTQIKNVDQLYQNLQKHRCCCGSNSVSMAVRLLQCTVHEGLHELLECAGCREGLVRISMGYIINYIL
jgi:hypothetical protein